MGGVDIKKPQGAGESTRGGCEQVSESADEKYWYSAKAQHRVIWVKPKKKDKIKNNKTRQKYKMPVQIPTPVLFAYKCSGDSGVFNSLLSKGANVCVVRLLHPNWLTERHLSTMPFSQYRLPWVQCCQQIPAASPPHPPHPPGTEKRAAVQVDSRLWPGQRKRPSQGRELKESLKVETTQRHFGLFVVYRGSAAGQQMLGWSFSFLNGDFIPKHPLTRSLSLFHMT